MYKEHILLGCHCLSLLYSTCVSFATVPALWCIYHSHTHTTDVNPPWNKGIPKLPWVSGDLEMVICRGRGKKVRQGMHHTAGNLGSSLPVSISCDMPARCFPSLLFSVPLHSQKSYWQIRTMHQCISTLLNWSSLYPQLLSLNGCDETCVLVVRWCFV